MENINITLGELKKQIKAKAYHPYLQVFLDEPKIDEDKLLILTALYNGRTDRKAVDEMLAVMMVQIALDTHELVSNSGSADTSAELKDRQLHVLGGDYYSGLYYQLLAGAENIGLIRVLSNAIKDINENKIALYQKSLTGIPELLACVKTIESALIHETAGLNGKISWHSASEEFLLYKRLVNEKLQAAEFGQSLVYDAMAELQFPGRMELSSRQRETIFGIMETAASESAERALQTAAELGPAAAGMKEKIQSMIRDSATAKSASEEG